MTGTDEIERRVAAFEARPIQRRLIQAAAEISAGPADETWFLHTAFCQAYLPASRPNPQIRAWERQNGDVTICLEAGHAFDPVARTFAPLPLPYGAKARLALIGLISEAVCAKSPEIDTGRSMTAFLAELLQRAPAGRDIRQFRQQLAALIVATMRIGWVLRDETPVQISTPIATLVEGLDPAAWAGRETRKGRWPWPRLVLSGPFFRALAGHSVPLDPRALTRLAHSPLALDMYCWLAQRLHRIDPAASAFVPWAALYKQFGGFARLRDFRSHFLGVLATIMATVYRKARVTEEFASNGLPTGLRLRYTPPPVPEDKRVGGS